MTTTKAMRIRFRALIYFLIGVMLFTVGLPITAIVWIATGKNLVFSIWMKAEKLVESVQH